MTTTIYWYIRYIGRSRINRFFFSYINSHPPPSISLINDNFLGLSKLTQIITYSSICHKNLRFCWKLLRTIIYSLELEKLIITFFRKKFLKMWICYNRYISKNISILYRYTPIHRTPVYRYIEPQYIDI